MKKQYLDELNFSQLYNFILFVLYKLRNHPDFLVLSELMLLLDKDSVLTLFEYFGGMTLRIPKIEELQLVIKAMNVFIDVTFNKKTPEECFASIPKDDRKDVARCYSMMSQLLANYNFNTGDGYKN